MPRAFLAYLGGRAVRSLFVVLGTVSLVFVVLRATPGDPVDLMLGDGAPLNERAALRASLGLDRSLGEQYVAFLGNIANGSLGTSWRKHSPVWSLIREVLPNTISLAAASVIVAWIIAIPLGSLAARRRGSTIDRVATTVSLLGVALPTVWIGPLLVLIFAIGLRVLPMPGDEDAGLASVVLPSFTLGAALAAILTRQTRGSMISVLSEQYVTAARARGASELSTTVKHALRNALLPVVTIAGAQLAAVLSGAVVTEKIFERPGLGSLFLEAYFERDLPVVEGTMIVVSTTLVLVNLVIDLIYGVLDPRIRVGGS